MAANDAVSAAATMVVHADPIAPVIFGATLILIAALVGRNFARRVDQPSVLGALCMGTLLGNVLAWPGCELMLVTHQGTAVMDVTAIIGASAAGVLLMDSQFKRWECETCRKYRIKERLRRSGPSWCRSFSS
jgi:Kef-type K+ transport system membrane component KefB